MTRGRTGNKVEATTEHWRDRIAEQERSGKSIQRFCEEQGLSERSFYSWRKRLRGEQPMRFALVETGTFRQAAASESGLELVLASGERLRIGASVDPITLRRVLEALRS